MSFLKEMLSGSNGVVSSKRIIGAITMVVVLGCTIYFTVHEGCTLFVENIIQTLIISACGLLGVTSVVNIFKTDKHHKNNESN